MIYNHNGKLWSYVFVRSQRYFVNFTIMDNEMLWSYVFTFSKISMKQKKKKVCKLHNNGQWKVVENTYFHFLRSQWNKNKLHNNGQWKVVVNTYFHFLRSQWNKKIFCKLHNNGQWKVVVICFHLLRSQWNKKIFCKLQSSRQ